MLESIPCFFIIILGGIRIAKIHRVQSSQQSYQNSSSRGIVMSGDAYSHVPTRSTTSMVTGQQDTTEICMPELSSRPPSAVSPSDYVRPLHNKSPSSLSGRQFHLPFSLQQQEKLKLVPESPGTAAFVALPESPFERRTTLVSSLADDPWWESRKNEEVNSPQRSSVRWDSESFDLRLATLLTKSTAQKYPSHLSYHHRKRKSYLWYGG